MFSHRWTASIIYQFFLVLCWDFWQLRYDQFHGDAGTLACTPHHALLDESIEDKPNQDPAGRTSNTCHFLHIHLVALKWYSFAHKEQWISSICTAGRRDFAAHCPPASPFEQEVDFMRTWLNFDVLDWIPLWLYAFLTLPSMSFSLHFYCYPVLS